jgi:hypothetical protein
MMFVFNHWQAMNYRDISAEKVMLDSGSRARRRAHPRQARSGQLLGPRRDPRQSARRWRVRSSTFALLGTVWILLGASGAAGQISPGPLSRAHKSLDSATQCTTCHKLGMGEATFKCLDCHTEIATRLAARRGMHPNLVTKAGSQDCARCHSEHNGLEFNLTKWDPRPEAFDHSKTGYKLEGKHAGLACGKCHTPEHIAPGEKQAIKIKDLSRTFLGVAPTCATCHEDFHKGQLGPNCQQCHSFNDWKKTTQFDHSKTRYPLTGLHAQVACEKCHTPDAAGKPRYKGIAFDRCTACHSDPHKGAFPQSCQTCHSTGGWKKVAEATLSQQFDHAKTKYPLLGKHAEVGCTKCHAGGEFKKPLAFAKCTDCHRPDPHGGQFAKRPDAGECSSCHNVEGWKPSRFGVPEHKTTKYPLEGKHASVECAKCHIPKGTATQYKVKFAQCTDCHADEHQGQFAKAPYLGKCEACHTLDGYKPSNFTLAKHKETRFVLAGSHVAVPCNECHKVDEASQPKPTAVYRWKDLSCTTCHRDPHKGQFAERMQKSGADGRALGCEACHSEKTWKDLSRFDHEATKFPLVGTHRAVECSGCHKPPNLETRLTNVDFRQAPTKCEDCHEDVHAGQFARTQKPTGCGDCHNSLKWRPSTFDHDKRTTFPLLGVHKNLRCGDCHKQKREVGGREVLFYLPTAKECAACHGAKV